LPDQAEEQDAAEGPCLFFEFRQILDISKICRGVQMVSLDNFRDRALARKDPEMFFQLSKPPLFIADIQYAPELFTAIKIQIDTRQRPGDFWLTGSQLFKLMRGVQESLAGRIALLQLLPLSQNETQAKARAPGPALSEPFRPEPGYLLEKQKHRKPAGVSEIFNRIFTGGMPALACGKYSNREYFYQSYINTYPDRASMLYSVVTRAFNVLSFGQFSIFSETIFQNIFKYNQKGSR
jgi:predicted AAA+ superfamily ATPase